MPGIDKKYKKDFKNLEYRNPRKVKEQEKRSAQMKKLIKISIIVLIVFLLYIFFFSAFFQIKEFTIEGLNRVKHENIQKLVDDYRYKNSLFVFSKNNFWLFSPKKLQQIIEHNYRFDNLEIKKKFPNKIKIQIQEKEPIISWLTGNFCYHLDNTGLAIEYCEGEDDYIRIKDKTDKEIEIGQTALAEDKLSYIVNLDQELKNLQKEVEFSPTVFEKEQDSILVQTDNSFYLLMNANLAVEEQVNKLSFMLDQDDVKEGIGQISYFDLRFDDKVYYK